MDIACDCFRPKRLKGRTYSRAPCILSSISTPRITAILISRRPVRSLAGLVTRVRSRLWSRVHACSRHSCANAPPVHGMHASLAFLRTRAYNPAKVRKRWAISFQCTAFSWTRHVSPPGGLGLTGGARRCNYPAGEHDGPRDFPGWGIRKLYAPLSLQRR